MDYAFLNNQKLPIDMAKLYYAEFKRQMVSDPSKKLRVAIIYSY